MELFNYYFFPSANASSKAVIQPLNWLPGSALVTVRCLDLFVDVCRFQTKGLLAETMSAVNTNNTWDDVSSSVCVFVHQ